MFSRWRLRRPTKSFMLQRAKDRSAAILTSTSFRLEKDHKSRIGRSTSVLEKVRNTRSIIKPVTNCYKKFYGFNYKHNNYGLDNSGH